MKKIMMGSRRMYRLMTGKAVSKVRSMQARLAAERLDVNSQTVRKPNGRVNTWVGGKMGHAFFRFKKKKKSRKLLTTPTKVQPRRIPRMEGNSSKETLGAEKLKPALYPDAFPGGDV